MRKWLKMQSKKNTRYESTVRLSAKKEMVPMDQSQLTIEHLHS